MPDGSTASKNVLIACAAFSEMFAHEASASSDEEELEDSSELEDASSDEDDGSSEDDDGSSELETSAVEEEDSDDASLVPLEDDFVASLDEVVASDEASAEDEFVGVPQEASKALASTSAIKFFLFHKDFS